jgi:hypothetical protein
MRLGIVAVTLAVVLCGLEYFEHPYGNLYQSVRAWASGTSSLPPLRFATPANAAARPGTGVTIAELRACAEEQNSAARLKCFDTAMGRDEVKAADDGRPSVGVQLRPRPNRS